MEHDIRLKFNTLYAIVPDVLNVGKQEAVEAFTWSHVHAIWNSASPNPKILWERKNMQLSLSAVPKWAAYLNL